TLTYDPSGRQWILFGGAEDDSTVWILSDRGRAAWRVLSTRGETPSPRAFHSAAYDSASHSVLIYGGVSLRTLRFFDDVWRLSLTNPPTWTRVDPVSAGPGKRAWHGAVLDPAGQRMLVFGGRDSTSHATDELWQLSLGESPTWAQIETQGESPGPMADLSFLYDTNRGRAILVSGSSGARDVWSLNLSGTPRWTLIAQNGPLVSRNGATFDAVGDRILALNATFLFKPWELPLSGPAEWRAIPVGGDAPSPRQAPIACNSRGDEIAMFGGSDGQGLNLSDLWILSLPRNASTTLRPRAGAREINFGQVSLAPPHPNPSRSGVSFAYTQPASAYVKISVFDGAGRLVRNLFDGASEEGSHEVSWDGMQQGGSRARAGVYYCAMTIGGQTLSRKFVLISP
ncbi:MAG TPA: kelch repeat-containing protein, partial [Candidatus Eisenbacteria bacterium]|nr:kelch repeat-containing protein [Candidatus Eisenbacteria bacterium]